MFCLDLPLTVIRPVCYCLFSNWFHTDSVVAPCMSFSFVIQIRYDDDLRWQHTIQSRASVVQHFAIEIHVNVHVYDTIRYDSTV